MLSFVWLMCVFLGLVIGKEVPIGFQRVPFGPEGGPIGFQGGKFGPDGPLNFKNLEKKFEASAGNTVVNCGNHTAADCADCGLGVGKYGCLNTGDCKWNEMTSTCVAKVSVKSTCKNLESWCEAAKPNCEEDFVQKKCMKYCNLCPDLSKCENKATICDAAQPNCNTDYAIKNCQKYCGICESNTCGLKKCFDKKCCKFQTCEDLRSPNIPDPKTWTCEDICPINPAFCSEEEATNRSETRAPTTTPPPRPQSLEIRKLKIETGKDGTDDKMLLKICSDVNSNRCCSSVLSGPEKDQEDFVQGQSDTWNVAQLGRGCENQNFQIRNVPKISITKIGTDNLEITGVNLFMVNKVDEQIRFSCGGFRLLGACTGRGCTFNYESCKNCDRDTC